MKVIKPSTSHIIPICTYTSICKHVCISVCAHARHEENRGVCIIFYQIHSATNKVIPTRIKFNSFTRLSTCNLYLSIRSMSSRSLGFIPHFVSISKHTRFRPTLVETNSFTYIVRSIQANTLAHITIR